MTRFPYTTPGEFRQDFEQAWKHGASFNGTTNEVPWQSPYGIYQNIGTSTLKMMVMGNSEFTGETSKLNNFGVTADKPARSMWKALSEATDWDTASNDFRKATESLCFADQADAMNRFSALASASQAQARDIIADRTRAIDPRLKRFAKIKFDTYDQGDATLSANDRAELERWEVLFEERAGDSWSSVSGAILWDQQWTPGVNDAWLLGAIHRQFEFHYTDNSMGGGVTGPGSKVGPQGQLWSDDNTGDAKLRVTGRELLGLDHFGYERDRSLGDYQISFYLANHNKWRQATFTNYNRLMKDLHAQGIDAIRNALVNLSIKIFGYA